MSQYISVALYDRDHFSRGNARRTFGYDAFHWGIVILPKTAGQAQSQTQDQDQNQTQDQSQEQEQKPEQGGHSFEATDASAIDPQTFRMTNPSMDWWLRTKQNPDLSPSTKLLGRVVIGEVPDGVSAADLCALFEAVPLPVKNTHPQQSCVSWVVDAVDAMQAVGWVRGFEVAGLKDLALGYADERMKGVDAVEGEVKFAL